MGEILEKLPSFLKNDAFYRNFIEIFDFELENLKKRLKKLEIYTFIDGLEEKDLDLVALGWKISWYRKDFPLPAKRSIVKTALPTFARLGTAESMISAVSSAFGEAGVEEWFNYGGAPFHFRIFVENEEVTSQSAEAFLQTVENTKSKRSVLDEISILRKSPANLKLGCAAVLIEEVRSEFVG